MYNYWIGPMPGREFVDDCAPAKSVEPCPHKGKILSKLYDGTITDEKALRLAFVRSLYPFSRHLDLLIVHNRSRWRTETSTT